MPPQYDWPFDTASRSIVVAISCGSAACAALDPWFSVLEQLENSQDDSLRPLSDVASSFAFIASCEVVYSLRVHLHMDIAF